MENLDERLEELLEPFDVDPETRRAIGALVVEMVESRQQVTSPRKRGW